MAVDNSKINVMANCALGFLNLRTYTAKTAFDNTGYDLANGATRTGKEQLTCVACKPGY